MAVWSLITIVGTWWLALLAFGWVLCRAATQGDD
jgi:hypothetical protein